MSKADENASGQQEGLGERLLRLLSPTGGSDHKNRTSARSAIAQLLRLGAPETLWQLALLAILAALCGTGVLFLLNAEVEQVDEQSYSTLTAVFFVVFLVIYRVSQSRFLRNAASAIEIALDHKRQRVVADVLQLSLRDIELIEAGRLRDGIAGSYQSLSQTLVPLIGGVQSTVLLVFMFAYLLSLSIFASVLTLVVGGVTVAGYLNLSKQMESEMVATSIADARFRSLTDAIVVGAKELQLSLRRRVGLHEAMQASSEALAKGRSNTAGHIADIIATGTTYAYLMAGAMVFIMPLVSEPVDGDISRIVVAVIFLLGPIGSIVQTAQQLATAQYALSAINNFETEVAKLKANSAELLERRTKCKDQSVEPLVFDEIEMEKVEYVHLGDQSFAVSDIDLTLRKGEIVFLTGGNGSGKTTLLRVLTGLYPRSAGRFSLNGQDVTEMPPQAYREFFASVFSDFHLFEEPFGLDEAGIAAFDSWLVQLGIRDKVGDELTHIAADQLSGGQRKRVALALALAEARPILVLDEWAADQDPATRRRFYEEILPALKAEGRTVLAITHDEQFFHLCDRRLHMVEGRLIPGDQK